MERTRPATSIPSKKKVTFDHCQGVCSAAVEGICILDSTMDRTRPATSIPSKKKVTFDHPKRPHSAPSYHYLKDKKALEKSSETEPAWRSRVKSASIPSKSRKSKPELESPKSSFERFDIEQYVATYPEGSPRIGINGKSSDSNYSKTVLKTVSRCRKYGSLDQVPSSDEDDRLDSTVQPPVQQPPVEKLFEIGPDGTPPIHWDEEIERNIVRAAAASRMPHVSDKQIQCDDTAQTAGGPPSAPKLPSTGCLPLSPLTSSVSILQTKTGSASSHGVGNSIPQCILVPLETSLVSLDFLITWQDRCIVPWKPSIVDRGREDLPGNASHRRLSGGLQVDGTTAFRSAEQDVQFQDTATVESLLKRMIVSASRSPKDTNVQNDLLCIWFKLPNRYDSFHSSFHSSAFDVYLSQSTASQISTRIVRKQSPKRVIHNLYVLKLNLSLWLPWIKSTESLEGRHLELLLYLVKPHRFHGCVYQEMMQLLPATPATPPPSQAVDSNSSSGLDKPTSAQSIDKTLQQQNRQTDVDSAAQDDQDCLTVARDNAVFDPSSQQVQEFVLSLYENPYQVNTRSREYHPPTRRHNSDDLQNSSYAGIVHNHIEQFVGVDEKRHSPTSNFKHKVTIPTLNFKSGMKSSSAHSATGGKKSVHFKEANHFKIKNISNELVVQPPF